MRLLLISQDYPPPFVGGSVVYVHNLLEGLKERVVVLTGALPAATAEVIAGRHEAIRTRWLTSSHGPSRLALFAMYAYMPWWLLSRSVHRKFDAAILSTGVVGNSLLIPILVALRVPVIPIAYAEELTIPLHGGGAKKRIKQWLMRFSYRRASGVVAVCGFTRDVVASIGVDRSRVAVIVPTISQVKAIQVMKRNRQAGRQVLTVGRLVARKGFSFLIQAVSLLRDELPDISLVIVGDGDERQALEAQVESLGLQAHVRFAGLTTDEDLRDLYEQSDVFVLACVTMENGDCEGTPTVFIEASAFGLPVIAGASGGTDAAVEDGYNGFRVDCRDIDALAARLRTLLVDPILAKRMGEAGVAKVAAEHLPAIAGNRLREFVAEILRYGP